MKRLKKHRTKSEKPNSEKCLEGPSRSTSVTHEPSPIENNEEHQEHTPLGRESQITQEDKNLWTNSTESVVKQRDVEFDDYLADLLL